MGLTSKLVELVDGVSYLHKGGKNEYHGYTYVREEDILDAVRDKMIELGLVMYPNEIEIVGANGTILTALVTYRVLDSETGEFLDIRVVAQGADSQDKGAYKLMTGARKYAIRQLVLAPTGDDPERDDDSLDRLCRHSRTPIVIRKLIDVGLVSRDPASDPFLERMSDVIGTRIFDVTDVEVLRTVYRVATNVGNDPERFLDELKEALGG